MPDTKSMLQKMDQAIAEELKAEHSVMMEQLESEEEKQGVDKKAKKKQRQGGVICCCYAEGCRIGPMVERQGV